MKLLGAIVIFAIGLLLCAGIDALKGAGIDWPVNVACSTASVVAYLCFSKGEQ
jgi:low affinity Fe/Cu permease